LREEKTPDTQVCLLLNLGASKSTPTSIVTKFGVGEWDCSVAPIGRETAEILRFYQIWKFGALVQTAFTDECISCTTVHDNNGNNNAVANWLHKISTEVFDFKYAHYILYYGRPME